MKKEDIINAYCRIRTVDHTIPDDVLDFMKDSAIKELERALKILPLVKDCVSYLADKDVYEN